MEEQLKKNKKTSKFIRNAKAIHGDRYDYSLVENVNHHTKVKIICPKHGVFKMSRNHHLRGLGCPKAGFA